MGVMHLEIIWLLIWLLKRGFRSVAQIMSCSLDLGKEMQKTEFLAIGKLYRCGSGECS